MLDALKDLYTGVVYDTLRDMGITNCVLDNDIRPVYPINKLYGKIWTCEGQYSENIVQFPWIESAKEQQDIFRILNEKNRPINLF